jgi:hypothetical protein
VQRRREKRHGLDAQSGGNMIGADGLTAPLAGTEASPSGRSPTFAASRRFWRAERGPDVEKRQREWQCRKQEAAKSAAIQSGSPQSEGGAGSERVTGRKDQGRPARGSGTSTTAQWERSRRAGPQLRPGSGVHQSPCDLPHLGTFIAPWPRGEPESLLRSC